jgi:hypothetical protein
MDAVSAPTSMIDSGLRDNVELIELGEAEGDAEIVTEAEAALKDAGRNRRREGARGAAGRRGRRQRHLPRDQRRRRRHRKLRLGEMLARMYVRWAEKHGYTVELQSESRRRRGGDQVGQLQDQRQERLWLAEVGIGRAPAGAHLALRQRGAAAHVLLLGLGLSGGRRQHRDRGARTRTSASTPTGRRARAASTSTRPTRRCGSPTSRPGSW